MRLNEFRNAIEIISRYPLFGIGFAQAPDIDLGAGVSSIYLALAERIGLLGLGGSSASSQPSSFAAGARCARPSTPVAMSRWAAG